MQDPGSTTMGEPHVQIAPALLRSGKQRLDSRLFGNRSIGRTTGFDFVYLGSIPSSRTGVSDSVEVP